MNIGLNNIYIYIIFFLIYYSFIHILIVLFYFYFIIFLFFIFLFLFFANNSKFISDPNKIAAETLAEVPFQLVSYARKNDVYPPFAVRTQAADPAAAQKK